MKLLLAHTSSITLLTISSSSSSFSSMMPSWLWMGTILLLFFLYNGDGSVAFWVKYRFQQYLSIQSSSWLLPILLVSLLPRTVKQWMTWTVLGQTCLSILVVFNIHALTLAHLDPTLQWSRTESTLKLFSLSCNSNVVTYSGRHTSD